MKILVNGKIKEYENSLNITVIDLLRDLNLNPDIIIVEKNNKIINKEIFLTELIKDDDKIELIRFMGGGK